jgi:hypothetical protein
MCASRIPLRDEPGRCGFITKAETCQVSRTLREGDPVGGFEVLEVPGHSPGALAFWRERDRVLVCGDVLPTSACDPTDPRLVLAPSRCHGTPKPTVAPGAAWPSCGRGWPVSGMALRSPTRIGSPTPSTSSAVLSAGRAEPGSTETSSRSALSSQVGKPFGSRRAPHPEGARSSRRNGRRSARRGTAIYTSLPSASAWGRTGAAGVGIVISAAVGARAGAREPDRGVVPARCPALPAPHPADQATRSSSGSSTASGSAAVDGRRIAASGRNAATPATAAAVTNAAW